MSRKFYYFCRKCGDNTTEKNIVQEQQFVFFKSTCSSCNESIIWTDNFYPAQVLLEVEKMLEFLPAILQELKKSFKLLLSPAELERFQSPELLKQRNNFKNLAEFDEMFAGKESVVGIFGLEALAEFCYVNGNTAINFLKKAGFIENYFLATTPHSRLMYFEHLTKEIKRVFINELASILEVTIRVLGDKCLIGENKPKNAWEEILEKEAYNKEILNLSEKLQKELKAMGGKFIPFPRYVSKFKTTKGNKLVKLVFALRNTTHNGGFYRQLGAEKMEDIDYEGWKFQFVDKQEVTLPLWLLPPLIKDSMDMLCELQSEISTEFKIL